ncbi:MAG: hypothetical protein WDN03_17925 [Rhizomicrobium sp.]
MSSLPFTVSLDLALSGPGAVPRADFDAALKEADTALAWLKAQKAAGAIELLDIVERTDDIEAAKAAVAPWRKDTTDVAVLGIGGSSLGGQALKAIAKAGGTPRVAFTTIPIPGAGRRRWPASTSRPRASW